MTAPTPAAVRALMKWPNGVTEEEHQALADDRCPSEWHLLRDHIRAIAADMRAEAQMAEAKSNAMPLIAAEVAQKYADTLNGFADKLEGKQ